MKDLAAIERAFEAAWPSAVAAFSPYTRLASPIYCRSTDDEKREGLEGSFAMIRMRDDRIVIGIGQIADMNLEAHAHAILAHEVGHYVHAPGTLDDHVRLHDRIRRTLPGELASHAGLVANLYTDLLLNDRLQRERAADIAGVYRALKRDDAGALWTLYTRTYERLWGLPTGELGPKPSTTEELDADLGARIVRTFRDRWLEGAASFALLLEPYLAELPRDRQILPAWLDTAATSIGDRIPGGLVDDDFDPSDVPHPSLDPRITGEDTADDGDDRPGGRGRAEGRGRARTGDGRPDGRKVQRGPQEWIELLRAVGVRADTNELVARYYRELAMPHVIPFPSRRIERAGDPLPEGLDAWELGSPLENIDWFESLARSPVIIPGLTTIERVHGVTEGGEPELRPPDLYVGIDCSGSMGNPAYRIAYPIVAGVVLVLSALRAGARVMVCLSGESLGQGRFVETAGFVRDEKQLLGVLTDYLGTGCSFGLPRLAKTFAARCDRPAHVVVVSDTDFFHEIEGTKEGWGIAKRAIENAGGGASAVLRLDDSPHHAPWLAKCREAGFETYGVATEAELVAFARAFARRKFAALDRN